MANPSVVANPIGKRVSVTVETIDQISGGRFKVKIKEPNLNLLDMDHEGRHFITTKDYGRGRYVMKEVTTVSQEDMNREWEGL